MTLADVVGFVVPMLTLGWQPTPERGDLRAAKRACRRGRCNAAVNALRVMRKRSHRSTGSA